MATDPTDDLFTDFFDDQRNETVVHVDAAVDVDDVANVAVVDVNHISRSLVVERSVRRQFHRAASFQLHFSRPALQNHTKQFNFPFKKLQLFNEKLFTPCSNPVRISGPLVSSAMATGTVMSSRWLRLRTASRTDAMVAPWYS